MANKKVSLGKVLGNVAKSTEKASKKTTTKKKDDEKKKSVAKQEKQTSVQKASADAYKNYLESKKTTNATQTAESKGATKSKANGRVVAGKTIVKNKAAESRGDKRASNSNLVGKNYGTTASQEKENKRKSQVNAIKSMYDDPVKLRNATVKDNGSQGSTYGMTKKEAEDTVKYWKSLDANAKNRIINKMTKDTNWKNVDKAIDKEKKTTKITKEDFDSNQSLIMQNATRMNGVARNAVLNSDLYRDSVTGKTLSQMAAEQNAYNYAKGGISVASQEFLNATSPLMNNLTDGYEYTQAQKDAIQKGKDSVAGKVGYMAGIGASSVVGGVTGMESAMGKMLYKQGGKSAVKRWLANRGADMIINSGIDIADSVKSATDVDGNLDLGQAAKNMLVNEAMNLGVGGAMDTIGVGLKSVQVKRALQIKNKLNKGIELDASELKLLAKINQNQLDDGYYFYDNAMKQTQDSARQARNLEKYMSNPNIGKSMDNALGSRPFGSSPELLENEARIADINKSIDDYTRNIKYVNAEGQNRLVEQYGKDYDELKTREAYKPEGMKRLADEESDALLAKIQNGTATDDEFARFGELVDRMRELDKQIPEPPKEKTVTSRPTKKATTMGEKYNTPQRRATAGVNASKKGSDYEALYVRPGTSRVKPKETPKVADKYNKATSKALKTTDTQAESITRYEELGNQKKEINKELKQIDKDLANQKGDPIKLSEREDELSEQLDAINKEMKSLYKSKKAYETAKAEPPQVSNRHKGKVENRAGVVKAKPSTMGDKYTAKNRGKATVKGKESTPSTYTHKDGYEMHKVASPEPKKGDPKFSNEYSKNSIEMHGWKPNAPDIDLEIVNLRDVTQETWESELALFKEFGKKNGFAKDFNYEKALDDFIANMKARGLNDGLGYMHRSNFKPHTKPKPVRWEGDSKASNPGVKPGKGADEIKAETSTPKTHTKINPKKLEQAPVEKKGSLNPKKLQKASGTYLGNVDNRLERAEARRFEGKAKRMNEVAEPEVKVETPKVETEVETTTARVDIETLKRESKELNDLVEKYNAETDPTKRAELKKELDTKWKASVERGSKAGDELRDAIRKENITTPEEEIRRILNEKEPKAESPKAEKVEETPKTEQTKVEETPKVETPKAEEPKTEVKEEPKSEELKGTKTEKVKTVDDKIDAKFKDDNTDVTTDDIIKNMKDGKKKLDQLIKGKALSRTYKRFAKWALENANDKGKAFDMLSDMKIAGEGNKRAYTNMEQAVTKAEADVKEDFDKVYNRVMSVDNKPDGTLAYDPYTYRAESQELLNELIDRFNKTGNLDDLDKIRKLAADNIDKGSQAGHALNACKMILRETPEGRLQLAMSELKRLNKKFGDRLKSPLELTEDEMRMILDAVKPEDVDKAFKQINNRLWSNIPSTAMEKFNEWRHFTMLANPKTHMRNFVGNGIFGIARQMSNCIEIGLAKGVQKAMKNSDNTLEMASWVSKKDLKDNKKFLDEQWNKWYDNTDSQNRYIESVRPQGMTEIRNKPMSKMIQFNYDWLEKEDRWFLEPAYKRSFMRYCKAHDIDLSKEVDSKVLEKASKYAEKQALYATYRDTSELSTLLTGLKQKTAGKKGKTVLGTAGYRTANMVIESALPFVKTPVNVFGRMVDYSPMGLIKSGASLQRFAAKGDYDSLADGIHYLSTGLTGSGVMALGVWAAHNGWIMTKTGEISGDAYYDRDMGYQDYSIVFPDGTPFLGGKSMSADWVAPMATSLFMGASVYESLSDEQYSYKDIINGVGAMVNPMMEMSFMSGSKDMVETFMENAIDRATGETHWSEAAFNAVFGSIPQNYMQSMMTSQMLGQVATGMDKYQRDTGSTKEDPIAKSWDSWVMKIKNRTPFLRQKLNKKVDRTGKDVETFGGDNLLTRWLNAVFNPSTTKKITYSETDKQLIDIYNNMPEDTDSQKKDKKYFFYNFTGNPSYDLVDGGRMSYEEKYKYTKENRVQQNLLVKEMIKDPGYSNMTYQMKADEVGDAHWIANTISDRKVYGDEYAVKGILKDAKSKEQIGYDNFKAGGGSDKDYVSFYITKEKLIAQTHDSDFYTKALATALYDRIRPGEGTRAARAFDIYSDKVEGAKAYLDGGGTIQDYTTASRKIIGGIEKFGDGVTTSMKNKAVSQGSYKEGTFDNATLNAMGIDTDDTNMGIGLSKKFDTKYTVESLTKMKAEMQMTYGDTKKDTVIKYIDSLGLTNNAEKACLFHYFSTSTKSPYGAIPNYCKGEGASTGGGSGRRGWGHRRGHGGGGSKGSVTNDYSKWLKDHTTSTSSTSKTSKSNLTEAFRKQQLKKLQNTTGTYKA